MTLCSSPWPVDGGHIDGCPVGCRLPAGHTGLHAAELTWDREGGWADVEPTRPRGRLSWCGAPYPWAAGVSCVKAPHSPEEPHRMGKGVTVDVGPAPEWPGNL